MWTSFIVQLVHSVDGEGKENGVYGRCLYFSQLRLSLFKITLKSGATFK